MKSKEFPSEPIDSSYPSMDKLSFTQSETEVVRLEDWPILLDNIGNVKDALITLSILEEGRANGIGEVSYPAIRSFLARKMDLDLSSPQEVERVLGKYNGLQERCNLLVGDIIHQSRNPEGGVLYSIAEEWQPQVEAYLQGVTTYSARHHLPFEAFLRTRKKGTSGLPISLEINQFLTSQLLLEEGKPSDRRVSSEEIWKQFPEQREYFKSINFYDILLDYQTLNLFTWEPVRITDARSECKLESDPSGRIISGTQRMKDGYAALVALQQESDNPNDYQHFTNLDVAYKMAELFPDKYKFYQDDNQLTNFMQGFSPFMHRIQKHNPGTVTVRCAVSTVRITESNNYQAVSDFANLLQYGSIEDSDSFVTLFRDETDPLQVRDLWLAGRYFDVKEYRLYQDEYRERVLPALQGVGRDFTTEKALQVIGSISKKPETVLYFLEHDGYITRDQKNTYRLELTQKATVEASSPVKQTSELVSDAPQVIFELKKTQEPVIVIPKWVSDIAKRKMYAHTLKDDEIQKWANTMRRNEKWLQGTGKIRWEFYKGLQKRDPNVVLFEDDHLLLVNKPAGVASHQSDDINIGVEEFVREVIDSEITLASWLDDDTSGIIALAKSRKALEGLLAQSLGMRMGSPFAELFLMVCDGQFYGNDVTTELYLIPHGAKFEPRLPSMMRIPRNARLGEAVFTKKESYHYRDGDQDRDKTLFSAQLLNGDTLLLRALAAFSLSPIAGDRLYSKMHKEVPRIMLHSQRFTGIHPITGKPFDVSAPLESVFEAYIKKISDNN